MPRALDELVALAAVPSVAFEGFDLAPVREGAGLTRELLEGSGFSNIEQIELETEHPSVIGELAGPEGAPTVLLYAHYDVQPAGDGWSTDPFAPAFGDDGRLHGRGTADDKSGIAVHTAVARAFNGAPPVNIKVVIEGEEETGVSALGAYMRASPSRFAADAVVICDVGNPALGRPALTTSLRGVVAVMLEVRTLDGAKHSGLVGGAAPDALMAMAKMLATLQDDNGDCAIPGLQASQWEGEQIEDDHYRQMAGLLPGVARIGSGSVADHLFARPSVNVLGLDIPGVHGARNILHDGARAKISVRIPPGQDPAAAQDALVAHLESVTRWGAQVTVTRLEACAGYAVTQGPVQSLAREAMTAVYGQPAGITGCGMTIPLVHDIAAALPDAALLLWGAEEPSAQIHAANESVDPAELQRVALTEARFLSDLGQSG